MEGLWYMNGVFENDQDECSDWINFLNWDFSEQKDAAADECDEVTSSQIEGDARALSVSPDDRSRTDGINRTKGSGRNPDEGEVDNCLEPYQVVVSKSSEGIELLNTTTSSQVLEASTLSGSKRHPQTAFEYRTPEWFPSTDSFMSDACSTREPFHFSPYVQTRDACTVVPFHVTESRSKFGCVDQQKTFLDSIGVNYSEITEAGTTTTCPLVSQQQNVLDCSAPESFEFTESRTTSGSVPDHQTLVGYSNLLSSSYDYDIAEISDIISLATVHSLPHVQNSDDCTLFYSPQPMDVATTNDHEFQTETRDEFVAQDYFEHCMETRVTRVAQDQTGDYSTQYGTLPLITHSQTYADDKALASSSFLATTWRFGLEDLDLALPVEESPICEPHRAELFDHGCQDFSRILEVPRASHAQTAQPGRTHEFESPVVDHDCTTEEVPLQASHHIEQTSYRPSLLLREVNELSCDMETLSATLLDLDNEEYSASDLRCCEPYHPRADILTGASPEESMKELTGDELLDDCFQQLEINTSVTPPDTEIATARNEIPTTGPYDTCSQSSTAVISKRTRGSRLVHSPQSLQILRTWWEHHQCNPYPNDRDVYEMIRRTSLTHQQIYDWFKNERSRKWKNDPKKRQRKTRLPQRATQTFRRWAQDHLCRPNPTRQQREQLAVDAGVTYEQASQWFMNFRKRCKAEIKKAKQHGMCACKG